MQYYHPAPLHTSNGYRRDYVQGFDELTFLNLVASILLASMLLNIHRLFNFTVFHSNLLLAFFKILSTQPVLSDFTGNEPLFSYNYGLTRSIKLPGIRQSGNSIMNEHSYGQSNVHTGYLPYG